VSVPEVTPALLSRYDVPGPRYTSYPAVPDWRGAFDHAAWAGHLAVLGTSAAPLALYVHLPFCASRCLYCGCNATVTTRAEVVDRYLTRLYRELDMLANATLVGCDVAAAELAEHGFGARARGHIAVEPPDPGPWKR
jgi:oxygen-independent coproporphyrinogen-3 oxidase